MSADFRRVAVRGKKGKPERLFRAAIAAFCSLTRPSRRELVQLDDLALPLFDSVSPEGRRFAAAALSECWDAPPALVRRLANEPVEISAPLLVRSRNLKDVDLITLIGRHGLPHARAIARRLRLNPVIGNLLDALKDPEIRRLRGGRPELTVVSERKPPQDESVLRGTPSAAQGDVAEDARQRLRAMMVPAGRASSVADIPATTAAIWPDVFPTLLETALTGHPPLFQTALADALGLEFAAARAVTGPYGYADLLVALRALDLREEQAFLLAFAIYPATFNGPSAIKLFLTRYRRLDADTARRRVEEWRAWAPGEGATSPHVPANRPAGPIRKAS